MPFNRPTPNQIYQGLLTEIDASIPGADSRVRYSSENMLARLIAMAAHELFGFLSFIANQILPDTAVAEYLERHATLWGILRKVATPAEGQIQFVGTNGVTIPAGSVLRRSDDVEYTVDADAVISGGVALASVTASIGGQTGNAVSGTKLTLTSPIAGVTSEAVVQSGGLSQGADVETDDELRGRIITRIQEPPHGGASFDYIAWALEVSGVTRAWCYPMQYGLGTVAVIFVMDNKVGTIIPDAGEVTAVQDHIDLVRPVTADVTVVAPTAVPVNLEIHLNPNTLVVQNAIKAEIEDFFKREAIPGGTLYLSRLNEAISAAAGEFDHIVVTPNANVVMTFGQLPTIGTYNWAAL